MIQPVPERSVRPGEPADRGFVRALARRVFSVYGEYDRVLPEWLGGAGVRSFVALEDGQRVGFALTCLSRLPPPLRDVNRRTPPGVRPLALDLMAIAIAPERQRRGLGRWLLGVVVETAEGLTRSADLPVAAVTLSVAEGNRPAHRLFERCGFRRFAEEDGRYPGGQVAWRMVRPLSGHAAR